MSLPLGPSRPWPCPFGASYLIDRGPVGTEDVPFCDPLRVPFDVCPFCAARFPFAAASALSRLFRASSTSFCRFSSAMRSRSALERNLGFAAAASFSRFALRMSSMLGGCFFCDAHPFLTFFGSSAGPSDSSSGGGGGGGASKLGGGGGGASSSGGGGGGGYSMLQEILKRLGVDGRQAAVARACVRVSSKSPKVVVAVARVKFQAHPGSATRRYG